MLLGNHCCAVQLAPAKSNTHGSDCKKLRNRHGVTTDESEDGALTQRLCAFVAATPVNRLLLELELPRRGQEGAGIRGRTRRTRTPPPWRPADSASDPRSPSRRCAPLRDGGGTVQASDGASL